jgi:thioredoxin-like negative regulator of GroEL
MEPVVLALENKFNGKMEFIIADITTPEGSYLAQQFNVDLIPRFFVLDRNGNPVLTEVGAQPKEVLENDILQVINNK